MKTAICILHFVLLCVGSNSLQAQSFAYKSLLDITYDKNFPVVKPYEVEGLEDAVFLDTREKIEFEVSHLKGARWVGFETFDMSALDTIDKDQTIVVYCSIGARSQDIGKMLQNSGYNSVFNLYGGIFHWVNEGLPVYKEGKETQKVHAYNRAWGIWLTNGEKVY
jgi:rhodanese-related sulfurtransferase